MVFAAGPRQVGKTILGLSLPDARQGCMNWDLPKHREWILRRELPFGSLWFLDEIHKYRNWRNYLKGLYDDRPDNQRILVTGSARLELYRLVTGSPTRSTDREPGRPASVEVGPLGRTPRGSISISSSSATPMGAKWTSLSPTAGGLYWRSNASGPSRGRTGIFVTGKNGFRNARRGW